MQAVSGSYFLICLSWNRNTSFIRSQYLPDGRDRKTSLIHQSTEFIDKLLHFVRRLGNVISQADLS